MGKKCIICNHEATLSIKGTSEVYCEDCAKEQFEDTSYLTKIENDATTKIERASDDDNEDDSQEEE